MQAAVFNSTVAAAGFRVKMQNPQAVVCLVMHPAEVQGKVCFKQPSWWNGCDNAAAAADVQCTYHCLLQIVTLGPRPLAVVLTPLVQHLLQT